MWRAEGHGIHHGPMSGCVKSIVETEEGPGRGGMADNNGPPSGEDVCTDQQVKECALNLSPSCSHQWGSVTIPGLSHAPGDIQPLLSFISSLL